MIIKINEDECIGCGACESICSEVFEVQDKAKVKEGGVKDNNRDDIYYLSKPLPFYSIGAFIDRVKDAWRVLLDKSRAYHYKEDE